MSLIYFNLYQISQILEEESGACCAEAGEGPGERMACWHLTARLLTLCDGLWCHQSSLAHPPATVCRVGDKVESILSQA